METVNRSNPSGRHQGPKPAREGTYSRFFTARHCAGPTETHTCLHDHAGASRPLPRMTWLDPMRRAARSVRVITAPRARRDRQERPMSDYGHAAFLATKPGWLDGAWAEARADHPEATEASS